MHMYTHTYIHTRTHTHTHLGRALGHAGLRGADGGLYGDLFLRQSLRQLLQRTRVVVVRLHGRIADIQRAAGAATHCRHCLGHYLVLKVAEEHMF